MDQNRLPGRQQAAVLFFFFFFLLFLAGFASSATFILDGVLDAHESTGRSLLQAKKSCTVNFEIQNYTIITSKCKGPQYAPKLCCDALKEFACPFSEQLNDLTNDCATTMFSYINLYGKYPPGLFAHECREGKEGLECPEELTAGIKAKSDQSSGHWARRISLVAIFISGFLLSFVLL